MGLDGKHALRHLNFFQSRAFHVLTAPVAAACTASQGALRSPEVVSAGQHLLLGLAVAAIHDHRWELLSS